jgi:uncharacterized protein (DUF302 family)
MAEPLVTATSPTDVSGTVQRITSLLQERGITLFATIDHALGAREVGLQLAAEVVLVFGNPAAGTPLMQRDPRVGIELPLRLLVWDDGGTTRVGYTDPTRLMREYELSDASEALHRMRDLLAGLIAAVTM